MILRLRRSLQKLASGKKKKVLQSFFKTGPGEYGEGDVFIGVTVPQCRLVALQFEKMSLTDVRQLLNSAVHEERLTALLILVNRFERAQTSERKKIFDFYLRNAERVNNWDLVDLTAYKIAGPYLLDRNKAVLYRLARSPVLWRRRIAVVTTLCFIRAGRYQEIFQLVRQLMGDSHDLMHKACGWMLREVGKRDQSALEKFLQSHGRLMPRTMLRYAVERFKASKRKQYLKGDF